MTTEQTRVDSEPISQRPARQDVMARLKLETAAEHDAVEAATGLMHPRLSVTEYRSYLEKTFGFYQPIEDALRRARVWDALGLPADERAKLPLLLSDLTRLGNESPAGLALCEHVPALGDTAEAVGCAYVLEGATLGGRIIARHVQRNLGPDAPRTFVEGYGEATGEKWQTFRAAVQRFARTRQIEDRIIRGAQETFRSFTRWLSLHHAA